VCVFVDTVAEATAQSIDAQHQHSETESTIQATGCEEEIVVPWQDATENMLMDDDETLESLQRKTGALA